MKLIYCEVCGWRLYEAEYKRLAQAVLLFHRGGEWTTKDQEAWFALTNERDATAKTLCDLARKAIEP